MTSFAAAAVSRSTSGPTIDRCAMTRWTELQLWPVFEKPPAASAATAQSRSASLWTRFGELPPSSSSRRLSGAAAPIFRAASTPAGERHRVHPVVADERRDASPAPGSTLIAEGGKPTSSRMSAIWSAHNGAWWAGFTTTALPAASAGATLCITRLNGALNGVTAATMPSGSRIAKAVRPSPPGSASGAGTGSPSCSIAADVAASVYVARSISRRASRIALPVWRLIVDASSSFRSRMRSAASGELAVRSWIGMAAISWCPSGRRSAPCRPWRHRRGRHR